MCGTVVGSGDFIEAIGSRLHNWFQGSLCEALGGFKSIDLYEAGSGGRHGSD